jgi:hypothetical protein
MVMGMLAPVIDQRAVVPHTKQNAAGSMLFRPTLVAFGQLRGVPRLAAPAGRA